MKIKPKIPLLVDVDDFFLHLTVLKQLDNIGFLDVEITEKRILKKVKIPQKLLEFFMEIEIPPEEYINTILRDFTIQMFDSEETFHKHLYKKIFNAPEKIADKSTRTTLLKYIFDSIYRINITESFINRSDLNDFMIYLNKLKQMGYDECINNDIIEYHKVKSGKRFNLQEMYLKYLKDTKSK